MQLTLNMFCDKILNNRRKNIVLTSHAYPDGDSISSQLALYSLLKALGKNVVIFNNDLVPKIYRFLPNSDKIMTDYEMKFNADLLIFLDVIPWDRSGKVKELKDKGIPLVALDHHIYDQLPQCDFHIDSTASATAELVYRVFKEVNHPISKEVAINIYAGVLTDTGGFRHQNTNADVLRIAGEMAELGADPYQITRMIYYQRPQSFLQNLNKVLNTVEHIESKKTIIYHFSMEMNLGRPIRVEDTENITETISTIEGVNLYIFCKEYKNNEYKLSFRSRDDIDSRQLAVQLGGGGHKYAAGAKLRGNYKQVREHILSLIEHL